ncbi:hypothetical protein ACU4GD_36885 [Cupriavidus basilensis]
MHGAASGRSEWNWSDKAWLYYSSSGELAGVCVGFRATHRPPVAALAHSLCTLQATPAIAQPLADACRHGPARAHAPAQRNAAGAGLVRPRNTGERDNRVTNVTLSALEP